MRSACPVALLNKKPITARSFHSRLDVTATGPAYFIAECGEQLAWLASALASSSRDVIRHCTPSVENIDVRSTTSPNLKYRGQCDVVLGVTHVTTPDRFLLEMQNSWEVVVGGHNLIQGYPISRRPDGYLGLELPWNMLLGLMKANEACRFGEHILIKGQEGTLRLVNQTENVCLWHPIDSTTHQCCCDQLTTREDISNLESNRHILGSCTSDNSQILQNIDDDRVSLESGPLEHEAPRHYNVAETSSLNEAEVEFKSAAAFRPQEAVVALLGSRSGDVIGSWSTIRRFGNGALEGYQSTAEIELPENDAYFQSATETESGGDSFDTEQLSISDSSEYVEPMDINDPLYPIVIRVRHQLLGEYRSLTQHPTTGDGQEASTSGGASEQSSSRTRGAPSRNDLKRKRREEEDKEDADEKDFRRPQKGTNCDLDQASKKFFACPYFKKDSIEYDDCCTRTLSRIRDVKQHLARRHTPERYCQMCFISSFANQPSLQVHINNRTCVIQDPSMLKGISYDQRQRLSKKSNSSLDEEGQWFAIWDILFAESPKPDSVYLDVGLSTEMRLFREYSVTHGTSIVREQIMSNSGWSRRGITEAERQEVLDQGIAEGIRNLFHTWRLAQPLSSRSSRHRRNKIQRIDQGTTPMSSTDSGIVMGSQISSLEVGPQGRGSDQSCSTPEVVFPPTESMTRAEVQDSRIEQDSIVEVPELNDEDFVNATLLSSQEDDYNLECAYDFEGIDISTLPMCPSDFGYNLQSGQSWWPDVGI